MTEVYIMNHFRHLKNVLNYNIKKMAECAAIFCENPDKDFTRNRIFEFETIIKNVICLKSGSLQDEFLKLYEFSLKTSTSSAFIQARDKIKVEAFKILFERFNVKTQKEKLYKGYRLLAVDGTELPIDNTIYDKETTVLRRAANIKPYSGYHITALYDLIECTYEDLVIKGEAEKNEHIALCNMIDRYDEHQAIVIEDRLFESYNNYEHITNSGNKYLIRVRDIESTSTITKSLGPFPETDEFDIDVFRMLMLKQNKMIKACPLLYKFVPSTMNLIAE